MKLGRVGLSRRWAMGGCTDVWDLDLAKASSPRSTRALQSSINSLASTGLAQQYSEVCILEGDVPYKRVRVFLTGGGLRCGGAALLAWELNLRQARARRWP